MLSDEFDDGRFTLSNSYMNINNAQKYHLNIGECISFDGSKIYHGVMPVTSGIRCALNIWMTNTDFKYKRQTIILQIFLILSILPTEVPPNLSTTVFIDQILLL